MHRHINFQGRYSFALAESVAQGALRPLRAPHDEDEWISLPSFLFRCYSQAKTYKVTLPANIPAGKFWSFTVYDNQTRSMLDTPQRYPRAGSQRYPTPAAEASADGSTTVYFSPTKPQGVHAGNWIQTMPGKGWFTILRLYSPLEPFFTKEWRPSEVELVR